MKPNRKNVEFRSPLDVPCADLGKKEVDDLEKPVGSAFTDWES